VVNWCFNDDRGLLVPYPVAPKTRPNDAKAMLVARTRTPRWSLQVLIRVAYWNKYISPLSCDPQVQKKTMNPYSE